MLIRLAEPSDTPAVARVHVRTWQIAYRGLIPDETLDGMRPEDRRYTFAERGDDQPVTQLAVGDDDAVTGFATTGPARDDDQGGSGELYALYVDPDSWGTGVGRDLISSARQRLVSLGFTEAVLWVLAGNERAIRFYGIDGWRSDGCQKTEMLWGASVDEVRYVTSLR